MVLIVAAFGGGFYAGARFTHSEMVKNPEKFLEAYKAEMKDTAKVKYEKIKAILLEE